ncbi:hypothetical protein [Micromonospora sp. WMMC273]|uniref:hypothetical protein n=1 Tax=Micromonospora sp. WMMC273 TaxID=3015157 RepID=UPI0022B659C4|nr:hypothetical protein [Micromonospora sp. WMMC273]MCZ7478896.1 hypothetical protein [Micromonospora sp. WMMC273]
MFRYAIPTTAAAVFVGSHLFVSTDGDEVIPTFGTTTQDTPIAKVLRNVKADVRGKRLITTNIGSFQISSGKRVQAVGFKDTAPETTEAPAEVECPQAELHATPGTCACGVVTPATGPRKSAKEFRAELRAKKTPAKPQAPAAPAPAAEAPAVQEPAPAVEVAEQAPAAADATAAQGEPVTEAVEGLRVHHTERIVGGCTGTGHRNGVMTGRSRVIQGRDHVEVRLDCGHVRSPLLRVLRTGTSPA